MVLPFSSRALRAQVVTVVIRKPQESHRASRCGTVHPGIQEYNQEYISMWPTKPSLFEQLQQEAPENFLLRLIAS